MQKQLAARIQLNGIYIDELTFKRNLDFNGKIEEVTFNFNFKTGSKYDQEHKEISTTLFIEANKSKEGRPLPFTFSLSMTGSFHVEYITPEHLAQLEKINCPAIILPFLRETIATITSRAGFPPLYIPVINFAGQPKSLENITKETKE